MKAEQRMFGGCSRCAARRSVTGLPEFEFRFRTRSMSRACRATWLSWQTPLVILTASVLREWILISSEVAIHSPETLACISSVTHTHLLRTWYQRRRGYRDNDDGASMSSPGVLQLL